MLRRLDDFPIQHEITFIPTQELLQTFQLFGAVGIEIGKPTNTKKTPSGRTHSLFFTLAGREFRYDITTNRAASYHKLYEDGREIVVPDFVVRYLANLELFDIDSVNPKKHLQIERRAWGVPEYTQSILNPIVYAAYSRSRLGVCTPILVDLRRYNTQGVPHNLAAITKQYPVQILYMAAGCGIVDGCSTDIEGFINHD